MSWSRYLIDSKIELNEPDLSAAYDMFLDGSNVPDLSGNGNTMAAVGVDFQYNSVGAVGIFNGRNSTLLASVSDTLKLETDGTISFWMRPRSTPAGTHLLLGYGGAQYVSGYLIAQVSDEINVFWRSSTAIAATTGGVLQTGKLIHVVVVNDSGTVSLYVNGVFVDSGTAGGTIVDDRSTYIGGASTQWFFNGEISYVKIFESARSTAWVLAEYQRARDNLWMADYNADFSVVGVTAGHLENTPLRIASGSFKISPYIIDGLPAKAVECIAAGVISLLAGHYHDNDNDAAFGDFECWISKASGHTTRLGFINGQKDNLSNGYGIQILTDGTTTVEKWGTGSIITGGSLTPGTLTKLNLQRDSRSDAFTGRIDDVSFGSAVDSAYSYTNFSLFDLGIGDKIIWADVANGHAYKKRLVA